MFISDFIATYVDIYVIVIAFAVATLRQPATHDCRVFFHNPANNYNNSSMVKSLLEVFLCIIYFDFHFIKHQHWQFWRTMRTTQLNGAIVK